VPITKGNPFNTRYLSLIHSPSCTFLNHPFPPSLRSVLLAHLPCTRIIFYASFYHDYGKESRTLTDGLPDPSKRSNFFHRKNFPVLK
jgi:hypothetical protein